MEGKCARDVTRKEEAVVKEASEPSSQSGTSRYKLGNILSAIGRLSLSRHTSGREEGGEKKQRRGGMSGWRAL